jgi:hypothetical protein
MKPRRTHTSNQVYRLVGGNEDSDLWVTIYPPDDQSSKQIGSTWEPTPDERRAIADGANIELVIWGNAQPPVALRLSPYALGRRPDDPVNSPP